MSEIVRMRLLRYSVAASLDGYIARQDGSFDWIPHDSSVDFAAMHAQYGTYIMGRKTYEVCKAQGAQNPLNGRPRESVLVASKSLKGDECPDVTIISDNVIEEVKRQKEREGKDIWLFGGGELCGMCLDARLVDKIEVAIAPVLLRGGVKLIVDSDEGRKYEAKLQLESVEKLGESGMVICNYKVAYRQD
jgi:dihydrofolate reductase